MALDGGHMEPEHWWDPHVESALNAALSLKGVAIVGWLGLLFLAERLAPAAPEPPGPGPRWHRLLRNGGLWVVNVGLSPLVVVPVSIWAASLWSWRPEGWSGGWALLIDLLILDLWIYWWHRANHEVPFLWRFHEVHHLDRFLDTTSAVRFHFGEVLLSAAVRAVVIVALDIPWTSVLAFEALILAAAIFHHSNLRLPPPLESALSRVVVTPSIHWVHHHAIRRDTDSNYATVLSVWDRLFGTRSRTQRWADMPIGVEGRSEQPLPQLLLRPLNPP